MTSRKTKKAIERTTKVHAKVLRRLADPDASLTKGTPGPWGLETETRSDSGSELVITDAEGGTTVANLSDRSRDWANACADARLISAAPELLSAALAVLRAREDGTFGEDGVQGFKMLREAVAKAAASPAPPEEE